MVEVLTGLNREGEPITSICIDSNLYVGHLVDGSLVYIAKNGVGG